MNSMLLVLSSMFVGIVLGVLLRKWSFGWVEKGSVIVVWGLLFLLGIELGSNPQVVAALPTMGLSALIIALAAVIGSCAASLALYRWAKHRHKHSSAVASDLASDSHSTSAAPTPTSNSHPQDVASTPTSNSHSSGPSDKPSARNHPLRGSLIILAFFIAGSLIGYYRLFGEMKGVDKWSFYVLMLLILMVGFSIGHNRNAFNNLKKLDKHYLLLPLTTILGTLAACALISLVMRFSLTECLAVGSGQAYYSLSSILITQNKGIELGTIALLANIIRELIALLASPLLYKIFGPLSPIAAGGATTADTTLPIIRQLCGNDLAILSVYHGFLVDFSVPFLVTLFCAL